MACTCGAVGKEFCWCDSRILAAIAETNADLKAAESIVTAPEDAVTQAEWEILAHWNEIAEAAANQKAKRNAYPPNCDGGPWDCEEL